MGVVSLGAEQVREAVPMADAVAATSGRTNPSSLFLGQWSVCSAMLTG